MSLHQLSVIIPVLDDAPVLSMILSDLRRQQGVELDIIVADGESSDDPRQVTDRHRRCRLTRTPAGRGRQMNRGAELAHYDRLLFLHADSRIPRPDALARALQRWNRARAAVGHRRVAGRFPLRFRYGRPAPLRYQFLEAKTKLNRPWVFNGDQGLMLHRRFFDQLGGFDTSRPFLEDQVIGRQIDHRGHWVVFDDSIETSPRRFQREGFWRRYLVMALMMAAFAGDIDEFFDALPRLYPPQQHTEPPPVTQFMERLVAIIAAMPPRRRRATVEAITQLIADNLWQPFALLDLIADLDGSTLRLYDHLLSSRLADLAAAAFRTGGPRTAA